MPRRWHRLLRRIFIRLEKHFQRSRQTAGDSLMQRQPAPVLGCQLPALRQIVPELLLKLGDSRRVGGNDIGFAVMKKADDVEIDAADRGPAAVYHGGLAMKILVPVE